MLDFRPMGGGAVSRAVAAAYQQRLTPEVQISNTSTDVPTDLPAQVFAAVHATRTPLTGRRLQLATGYRGDLSTADNKIRQWQQLKAEMQHQAQADEPPAWLEPPTWITSRTRNSR